MSLSTQLPAGLGPDPTSPTVPTATLTMLLAEGLTDAGSGTLETVVCDGDLPAGGGQSVSCTATPEDAGSTGDREWIAYATHAVDGSPAVLWLQGTPLSPEFMALIGTPTSGAAAASLGPGYGADAVDAEAVERDAGKVLSTSGSPVVLDQCQGTLDFRAFEPVVCTGSANGAGMRILVLPGRILGGDPGLVVVTQPA